MADLTHRVRPGKKFSLADVATDDKGPFSGRDDPEAARQLAADVQRLSELQERLYAEQKQSLLVVFQAPDTAGKDGVLRKVVGPLDSRGVNVHSFKSPTSEELAHDYLWRVHAKTPRRGEITFFNRSHYEDVLIVRVLGLAPEATWRKRYEHIQAFERMLHDSGTRVVKFYLHISKAEQKRRLEERLRIPEKHWKFEPGNLDMRARWTEFQQAYEEAMQKTTTDDAPWHVVPADRKWYRDVAVARALVEVLEDMNPQFPKAKFDVSKIVVPD